jgi:microcystin degradation protein MlrC
MTLRFAAAQLSHETNAFSVVRTDMAAFEASTIRRGRQIVEDERDTNSTFGGLIAGAERFGFELVPMFSVWATPSGMVDGATLQALLDELVAGILHAGPVDGILLGLHGAMVSELDRDADALILETVRAVIGNDCPLVATFDLHANLSVRMVDAATMLIGYDTYPHIDMAERAREACERIVQLARGEIVPAAALVKPPMLPTSQRMTTDRAPMKTLIALAHDWEMQPGMLTVSVGGGFPPADVEEAGLSVLAYSDGDGTVALEAAEAIAARAWEIRDQFLGGVSTFQEAGEALSNVQTQKKPLVLVDIGDNPWTGGPGDSVELLRFLLTQSVQNAALALICDPEAVAVCMSAGPGATAQLTLGGKTDRLHGDPIEIDAYVRLLADGRYVNEGPMMAGVPVELGPCAVIMVGGVEVLVTSRAETPIDLNVFRAFGIEPTTRSVLALKGKGHFRAAFEPISAQVVLVEGHGITGADLSRLPFEHLTRPIWPLDADADW